MGNQFILLRRSTLLRTSVRRNLCNRWHSNTMLPIFDIRVGHPAKYRLLRTLNAPFSKPTMEIVYPRKILLRALITKS